MGPLDTFRVLVLLAFRNLFSHRVKTAIVGLILVFGTTLVVMGTALMDGIEYAMERSITSSVGGHLQVYSSKGKDELSLFGSGMMGQDDIGRIDDFSQLQETLSQVPGVRAVVPMGIDFASATAPGDLEGALEGLRFAVRDGDAGAREELAQRVRALLSQMQEERESSAKIASDTAELEQEIALIEQGRDPALWARFEAAPLEVLEFLDTKVAPLAEEGRMMYFRYLGTDVDEFVDNFDRFEVIKGERIPPNTRGFMFNERFYERMVKHRVARRLDWFEREIHEKERSIAEYPGYEARVRRLSRQYRRITYQLDAEESKALEAELKAYLPHVEGGLDELLQAFLLVTDDNFDERYAWFYEHIAPRIDLYSIDVGDVMTIRAYTRSGFLKALNIKVYGIFRFSGLEKSDLASGHSLLDMLTFRELYGLMTEAKKAELSKIKAEVGIEHVAKEDAELAFFGEDAEVVTEVAGEGFDEFEGVDFATRAANIDVSATFTKAEVEHGLALNAAVVLEDRAMVPQAKLAVEKALEDAGLQMKVVDWQQASGLLGQFIFVIQVILIVAVIIIFVVAVVIINNSMVMATMERVTEIGTMRAIGAQRSVVLVMFLLETLVLGAVAGTVGAALGAALIEYWSSAGLAAPNNQLIFLFGGPRLYPELNVSHVVIGYLVITIVSLISTLYPAFLATRIQPVMAMRAED